ncbi:FAD-dependent 2-octaprenylphenol hydroxylase [Candidatus Arsenophonus triatominarum]|uniref:FAD-dependent 2-octaprenylphenol hydroxylase n=1 Tax=Candidatus Arsenophonus triatominarum TaxID=57911 RepID=UPI0007C57E2E|nr:FAD-dependent 2-octaprenylphenol hydroxylase [Candidatus Arsenophonus triatominarum]
MQSFDVVIVGGGMVGLALACGLRGGGMRIAVIENSPVQHQFDPQQSPSLRVSAINAASQKLLDYLGVWQTIVQKRVGSYQQMEVWQQDSFGHIQFDAKQHYLPGLGYIIENSIIRGSLWQQAQSSKDITLLTDNRLKKVVWGENEVFMTFDNEQMLTARLVVGADGAKSWLREKADIPLSFWDYEHTALVATIRTEMPHMLTARQSFHNDSILAFLPLHDPHLCSIVWSLPAMQANRRLNLEVSAFEKELSVALDMRLGFCQLISERQILPLIGQYARNFAGQRIALLGDAAHTIHLLAGQGVNLGFMDVAELIGQLRRLNSAGKDIGQYFYLQSYERKRKHSAVLMLASMQGLRQLFDGNNPVKKMVRDVGLLLANTLPGIKPKLLSYALGAHDMPEWLAKVTTNSSEIV